MDTIQIDLLINRAILTNNITQLVCIPRFEVWTTFRSLLFCFVQGIQVASELIPSESECRPYIERALNTVKADNKGDGACKHPKWKYIAI